MPSVNYLWDPIEDNVIAEFDDDGILTVEYTTEPELYGDVISQRRNGETNCFYSDGLGSTTEVTNAAGDTIATRAYSVFGETTETSGDLEFAFQYVGQKGYYLDGETGEYYIRCRQYDPFIARWMSVDPLAFVQNDSPYVYTRNSSIGQIDPSGLMPFSNDNLRIGPPSGQSWLTFTVAAEGDKRPNGNGPSDLFGQILSEFPRLVSHVLIQGLPDCGHFSAKSKRFCTFNVSEKVKGVIARAKCAGMGIMFINKFFPEYSFERSLSCMDPKKCVSSMHIMQGFGFPVSLTITRAFVLRLLEIQRLLARDKDTQEGIDEQIEKVKTIHKDCSVAIRCLLFGQLDIEIGTCCDAK